MAVVKVTRRNIQEDRYSSIDLVRTDQRAIRRTKNTTALKYGQTWHSFCWSSGALGSRKCPELCNSLDLFIHSNTQSDILKFRHRGACGKIVFVGQSKFETTWSNPYLMLQLSFFASRRCRVVCQECLGCKLLWNWSLKSIEWVFSQSELFMRRGRRPNARGGHHNHGASSAGSSRPGKESQTSRESTESSPAAEEHSNVRPLIF